MALECAPRKKKHHHNVCTQNMHMKCDVHLFSCCARTRIVICVVSLASRTEYILNVLVWLGERSSHVEGV